MEIQMRSLQTGDIFPMSRILKKIGLKEIMKEAAANAAKPATEGEKQTQRESQMRVGAEVFAAVFENLFQAEEEVTDFLASLCNMTPDEFKKMDLGVVLSLVTKLQGQKVFANFLKQASQ